MTLKQLKHQINERLAIYREQLISCKKLNDIPVSLQLKYEPITGMVREAELEAKIMELNSILSMIGDV